MQNSDFGRAGASARGCRDASASSALEMSFTARRVGAKEAAALGLILQAVPADILEDRVVTLAQQIIANSRGSIAAYKDLYGMSQNLPLDQGLKFEARSSYPIADRQQRRASTVAGLGKG